MARQQNSNVADQRFGRNGKRADGRTAKRAGKRGYKSAYKKQRRKKQSGGKQRMASKVLRGVLIAVAVLLLVLPVLLLAHPISYVPLIMVVLMVALSWLYLQVADKAVSVSVGDGQEYTCTRGEKAGLKVQVRNASFLPVPRVELGFVISNLFQKADDERALTCSLAPFETLDVAFDANFAHLGKFQAGVRKVTVFDLLGLFSRTHKDGCMNTVVVRPAKVTLGGQAPDQAASDESNNALKPIASDNEDYASVREYHRGDPMKTIHWNLSSRNPDGTLYTRLYEEYVNPTMAIVIDHCAPAYEHETLMTLFDGMVESTVALSEQARLSGIDVEVRYFNAQGEESLARLANDDDVTSLVEDLHRIIPADEDEESAFDVANLMRGVGLQQGGFSNVALVTSRADAECLAVLRDIASRRKNAMALVAVPRDLEGRERDRFWEPIAALGTMGVYYYAVESNPLGTQVVGL